MTAACKFITNYSSGHETRAGAIGDERLSFIDRHIEIDNRLAWYLGRLHTKYGKDAYYVHLQRNLEDVAKSYAKRKKFGLMNMFNNGLLMGHDRSQLADLDLAREICITIDSNIRHFLVDKPNQMEMHLESLDAVSYTHVTLPTKA